MLFILSCSVIVRIRIIILNHNCTIVTVRVAATTIIIVSRTITVILMIKRRVRIVVRISYVLVITQRINISMGNRAFESYRDPTDCVSLMIFIIYGLSGADPWMIRRMFLLPMRLLRFFAIIVRVAFERTTTLFRLKQCIIQKTHARFRELSVSFRCIFVFIIIFIFAFIFILVFISIYVWDLERRISFYIINRMFPFSRFCRDFCEKFGKHS